MHSSHRPATLIDAGTLCVCAAGENLATAGMDPPRLPIANHLIYSPHVYGPGVGHEMPYFEAKGGEGAGAAAGFPANMEAIWDAHWGYLVDQVPRTHALL